MTLKAGFKQCKTDPCLLYIINELENLIFVVYVFYTLSIGGKPVFMDTNECIKKEYYTWSIGELEEFVGYNINRDITKITLNISQKDLITKISQVFNENVKSLMTFNTSDIPHKRIVRNQETDTKYHTIYRRDTGVA